MYDNPDVIENVSMHFLNDEAVLFDQVGQKIVSLNTSAAVVWCYLLEGLSPDRIPAEIARRFGMLPEIADRYVARTLHQWREAETQGGLREPARPEELLGTRGPDPEHDWKSVEPAVVERYRVLDAVVTLNFETDEMHRAIHPLFSHLAWTPGFEPHGDGHRITIDVSDLGGTWRFHENGRVIESCEGAAAAGATAKIVLVERSLATCRDFYALHAGAARAGGDGPCVLLPGPAGAGKSTLVAGLAAEGYAYLGDDTLVLTRDMDIRPLPCGLCVKKGAWDFLSVRFPRLRNAPEYGRPDGRRVRYLLPPDLPLDGALGAVPVGWIVFPRYMEGMPAEMRPLSKGAALERLLTCLVPLRGYLVSNEVERLIRWIEGIPCMELQMSSLNDAVGLIAHLSR